MVSFHIWTSLLQFVTHKTQWFVFRIDCKWWNLKHSYFFYFQVTQKTLNFAFFPSVIHRSFMDDPEIQYELFPTLIGSDEYWSIGTFCALNSATKHLNLAISSSVFHLRFIRDLFIFTWQNIVAWSVEKHWEHGWNNDVTSKSHQVLRCSMLDRCIFDVIDEKIVESSMLTMCPRQEIGSFISICGNLRKLTKISESASVKVTTFEEQIDDVQWWPY